MNIFITGVSSGIGRALVKELVKDGHVIWGVARRRELLQSLEAEVGKENFFYTVCDISSEKEVRETMRNIRKRSFRPDIVILNAAVYIEDMLPDYKHTFMSKAFMTNFIGTLTWIDQFLPDFLSRGEGHFIAISSTSALRPDPYSVSLPAAKAALSMAFRSLRLRYSVNDIIFSTVHFGPVASEISPKYASPRGGPKYPFVLTVKQAAAYIYKVINGHKSKDYFFPGFITLLFRLTLFFPDTLFARVSRFLKR